MDYVDVYELREKMLSDYLERIQNGASPEKAMIATVADAFTGNLTSTVEPKNGKWEFVGENLYMCTSCGYIANANWLSDWKHYKTDSEFPCACPKCGARMGVKENVKDTDNR